MKTTVSLHRHDIIVSNGKTTTPRALHFASRKISFRPWLAGTNCDLWSPRGFLTRLLAINVSFGRVRERARECGYPINMFANQVDRSELLSESDDSGI